MRRCLVLLSLLPSLLTGGCTNMLHDVTDWDCFPANDNHLQVYDAGAKKDFLVVYQELSERKKTVRPRAYYLYQNQNRVTLQQRPDFVSVGLTNGLPVVPVVPSMAAATNFSAGMCVLSTGITSFTIYSNQVPMINCNLPWYSDPLGRREQTLLGPPALVVDGVILIVVVGGLIVLYVYAHQADVP